MDLSCLKHSNYMHDNESTTGADASVEALKLYHMKLTLAYSSLLALLALVAQTQLTLLVGRIVQKMGNDRP